MNQSWDTGNGSTSEFSSDIIYATFHHSQRGLFWPDVHIQWTKTWEGLWSPRHMYEHSCGSFGNGLDSEYWLVIMAIERLIGRRGYPKKIFSCNGTNLREAGKELKNALDDLNKKEIISMLAINCIEFYFIPWSCSSNRNDS